MANLLIVGRFGSPLALELEVIHLDLCRGHESFMGDGKFPIEVVITLPLHIGCEVVAGDDGEGFKK
jgi:hypothetical protein